MTRTDGSSALAPDPYFYNSYLPADPQPEQVRQELARILATPSFSRADRPRRFLTFLVEHALRGEAGKINEYVLATEVFNRKANFDPVSDPIVRVEAGRLRRKLQQYYSTDGQDGSIRIELPPRTYVPAFRRAPAAPMPAVSPDQIRAPASKTRKTACVLTISAALAGIGSWLAADRGGGIWTQGARCQARTAAAPIPRTAHSIGIARFADLSKNHEYRYFSDGLTVELADALSGMNGIEVRTAATAADFSGKPNPTLLLEGAVRPSGDQLQIGVQLREASSGRALWSRTYYRSPKDALAIHDEIARSIMESLSAQPRRADLQRLVWPH
jgi:adenylate cyclase